MLAFNCTICGLVVAWDEVDGDPEDPLEVRPEVGGEGIAVVTRNRFTCSVSTQPPPDEGVTTV